MHRKALKAEGDGAEQRASIPGQAVFHASFSDPPPPVIVVTTFRVLRRYAIPVFCVTVWYDDRRSHYY
jgi:hypothetical protein